MKMVATVNQNGKVTAVGTGECIITVENSDGDYADCYVTVTGEGGVEEIELSDESLTLYVGEGYELEAYAYPEDADDTELVFSSSNENVVTVDEDGYLEALKEGRGHHHGEKPRFGRQGHLYRPGTGGVIP